MAAIELAGQLAYLACVFVAGRLWYQNRTRQAAWSAATFALLGGLVLLGFFLEEDQVLPDPWGSLLIFVVLLLPWLLWRFADSVVPAPRALRRVVDVVAITVAASGLVVDLPAPDATPTSSQQAWILLIVGTWLAQAILTTGLLWRAANGQPGVTRGRLRMLAAGSLLLGFAIVATAGPGSEETNEAISQVFSLVAALTFLAGYAPPKVLRQAWRSDDEVQLYRAAVGLLEAEEQTDVQRVLLPGLRALLGAPGVVARAADGSEVARNGEIPPGASLSAVTLGPWKLEFAEAPSMPLFGSGEEELIQRLGLMAHLATERVRLHASEKVAREQAEQASQDLADANGELEAVNDELEAFVYSTSHDLKNPIIAILGYVEVLQKDFAEQLPDDAAWYIERMAVNAQFIDSLIRDLLELSRVGRMDTNPDRVDLDEVLTGIAGDATTRHEDVSLSVEWPEHLPVLWANPTRTRQLFENLVENACRYAGRPDVEINITCTVDESGAVIDLTDNGAGIPADQCERIFGMFERLDPESSEGTGIGLAICRRIVDQLDGSIAALPSDSGAHFRIALPPTALAHNQALTTNDNDSAPNGAPKVPA